MPTPLDTMQSSSPPPPSQFPPGYLETDNGRNVIVANSIILVLTTILYALRLIARTLTTAKRGWDDHLLIPAYVLFLGSVAIIFAEVTQAGVGRHAASLDAGQITQYSLLLYLLFWFYVPSSMFSRVSVVALYLRIFVDKWARIACWLVILLLVGIGVGNVITAQVACTPLAYTWDKSIPNGKCINQLLWYQITASFNLAADVLILLLPIKTLSNLQTSLAHKIGIALVCLTGSIGLIASSVRLSVFFGQGEILTHDPTFYDQAFSWTTVECGFYLSAACLIGSRPLITRAPQRIKDIFRTSRTPASRGSLKDGDEVSLNRYYKNRQVDVEADETTHTPLEPVPAAGYDSPVPFGRQPRTHPESDLERR
ncbi:hypothetical protein F4782DRAFT_168392 [Xylaria castorea]|nr:hypothetical protein F4782DRAFT_168392 [Xylaria castorea]